MYDFAVIMTLFFAVGAAVGLENMTKTTWISMGVVLIGLWTGASIGGLRYGVSLRGYLKRLPKPFYDSRNDYAARKDRGQETWPRP